MRVDSLSLSVQPSCHGGYKKVSGVLLPIVSSRHLLQALRNHLLPSHFGQSCPADQFGRFDKSSAVSAFSTRHTAYIILAPRSVPSPPTPHTSNTLQHYYYYSFQSPCMSTLALSMPSPTQSMKVRMLSVVHCAIEPLV